MTLRAVLADKTTTAFFILTLMPEVLCIDTEPSESETATRVRTPPDLEGAARTGNAVAFAASARIADQSDLRTAKSRQAVVWLLFTMKRVSRIAIRTRDGARLKSPLILEAGNLHLIGTKPHTEDSILATHVAEMFAAAIYAHLRLPENRTRNFFEEVTHVLWQAQKPIRELTDRAVREIIITWLDSPYTETVEKPAAPDELSPQALRNLIERWKRQEPGTFPPCAPESS